MKLFKGIENSDCEYLTSITHIFNDKNEWIGYEYETIVSENHIRTSRYDDGGKIIDIKHRFINPLNTGSEKDFISYMNKTKSEGFTNNHSYISDIKRKPIDLTSSLEEVKRKMSD